MGLINRVAIGNVLNYFGDGSRKQWWPRFRYECLDFRGQSTAVNLTNGGGKTTLAEAMLAVLSRDHTLVSNTKKKFSPKRDGCWSHVQVELIRPLHGVGQVGLLEASGGQVGGELWVFGMYGYRDDPGMSYYFYKGALEDVPIAMQSGSQRALVTNEEFVLARKARSGLSMGPHEDEWEEALAMKVNLPQSTIRQMVDFQKRGGQDKSALLYEIKARPGQSYAEVFFYKVLAPAIMEGVMDKEGEEGEVRLEDTVERSVFSTVRAKQATAGRRKETEELAGGVDQLGRVMKAAQAAEQLRSEYEQRLRDVQGDVRVLAEMVDRARLPGVPHAALPEGVAGQVARHLVLVPGKTEVRVLDRALAVLLGKEVKHVNEHAARNNIDGEETAQVIEIPCDLFLQTKGVRGNKPKAYSVESAKALLDAAATLVDGMTKQTAGEYLEDAVSWLEDRADTNVCRERLVEQQGVLADTRAKVRELDEQLQGLYGEQSRLQQQQKTMETNEGLYTALVDSGLFTDAELKAPVSTGKVVAEALKQARGQMGDFERKEAGLKEHVEAWEEYVRQYDASRAPVQVLAAKQDEKAALVDSKNQIEKDLKAQADELDSVQSQHAALLRDRGGIDRKLGVLTEHREGYSAFVDRFGDISPLGKEQSLRTRLSGAEVEMARVEAERREYQAGVAALERFAQLIPHEASPEKWLAQVIARRSQIAVAQNEGESTLADLRQRRQALESDPVAPAAATREALGVLEQSGIDYQPLHQFVEDLGLEAARKRQVLGLFSALLFAPVLAHEREALAAARALADVGAQVPVFLRHSLSNYCESGTIVSVGAEELMIGTLAGVVTRPVDCLLDPTLVAREKALLDDRIKAQVAAVAALADELAGIADDTEQVIVARRAAKAVAGDESGKLKAANVRLGELADQIGVLREHTGPEVVTILRAAEAYVKHGGRAEDAALTQRLAQMVQECERCEESIAVHERRVGELRREVEALSERIGAALPVELFAMLHAAGTFWSQGGPQFMDQREQRRGELQQALASAEGRHAYSMHFQGAQAFLDSVGETDMTRKLQGALAQVARDIKRVVKEHEDARAAEQRLSDQVPLLRAAMESVDRAAMSSIRKYRKVARLSEDVGQGNVVDVEDAPLLELCDKLKDALGGQTAPEVAEQVAEKITVLLDDIDVDAKAGDLTRARKELKGKEEGFLEAVEHVRKTPGGLKPVEVQLLKEVQGAGDIPRVRGLYEGVLQQLAKAKDVLQDCERAEREARQGVTARLAHLVDYAAADLQILRKVVGAKRGAQASYFNVEADVLDREGIQRLMDGILAEVDVREQQRRERVEKGLHAPEDESYHESLRAVIRDKLYRTIFTGPRIAYVNPTIRAAGDAHEFNENLSEGQKAALSLMWAIRLAEFAIEREARRLSSRRSQQKAREMSVNIMLIDGLFSNLSDRELINSAMAGIESTRGSFQLIGLIHNPEYQNDFDKFPVFIIGKNESDGRPGHQRKGWVSFREATVPPTIRTAQIRRVPPPRRDNV